MTSVQVDVSEFNRATRLAYVVSELQRIRVMARARGEHFSTRQLAALVRELSDDVREAADLAMIIEGENQC